MCTTRARRLLAPPRPPPSSPAAATTRTECLRLRRPPTRKRCCRCSVQIHCPSTRPRLRLRQHRWLCSRRFRRQCGSCRSETDSRLRSSTFCLLLFRCLRRRCPCSHSGTRPFTRSTKVLRQLQLRSRSSLACWSRMPSTLPSEVGPNEQTHTHTHTSNSSTLIYFEVYATHTPTLLCNKQRPTTVQGTPPPITHHRCFHPFLPPTTTWQPHVPLPMLQYHLDRAHFLALQKAAALYKNSRITNRRWCRAQDGGGR